MLNLILALSLTPASFAEDAKAPYSLEFFQQRTGFCAHLPKDKIPPMDTSVAAAEKPYQERLQEETCKLLLLKDAISTSEQSSVCKELATKERSDCMAKAMEKIHSVEPLSTSGIALYSASQIGFVMKERKGAPKDTKSILVSKKIMALQIQLLKQLQSRAQPKNWQLKSQSVEASDQKTALTLCEKVRKIASKILDGNSDPEILANLSAEKKEFEALPVCQ